MLWKLVLVLTVTPLVELYLLVKLTEATNDFRITVLVILVTGVLGAVLARAQGLRVWNRIVGELRAGKLPGDSLMDGAMVLVAGALLVTPGLLTDAAGIFVLVPPCRALLREGLKRWLRRKIQQGRISVYTQMGLGPMGREPPHRPGPGEGEDS